MKLVEKTFVDSRHNQIRSVNIYGEAWFVANDICSALDYKNPRDAVMRHVDREDVVKHDTLTERGKQSLLYINESGLYALIFGSKQESAKQFKRWVTKEVLPEIRMTGSFATESTCSPNSVRRFNENWDRTDSGYFSVISELYIRLHGRLERNGYVIPDIGSHGKELRPDNSVGTLFSKHLNDNHPELVSKRKRYKHRLPDGTEIEAFQYPNEMLPMFIEYVEGVWIPERAESYFKKKDPKALEYLPELIAAH